ncbi:MAG: HEAT repeat domain-containing protein [Polyangiaceae bacterium]
MIRWPLRALTVGLLSIVAWTPPSSAEGRVSFFIDQLKNATDFRLRTQAALALGASEDPTAVSPLCGGLDDQSDTVRSASAAALGKLKNPAGLGCLKRHANDPSVSVRSVIDRSVQALESASGKPGKPPPPGPNDSVYVAIGVVTDKTGRGDESVSELVAGALQNKLLATRGYAVAPQGETTASARKVMRQNSLHGYMLQARVEPPRASSGGLTILVRITMWSYPDKALQGEFAPKLTMPGASLGDRESEDSLIKMAVERAVDSFAQVVAASN